MRVISLHDLQAGKVPLEADTRDRVMCDERAVVNLPRGRGRWAREDNDIRRTSVTMVLNRDKII